MFWKEHEYANLNNRPSDEENRFQNIFVFFKSREEKTLTETNLHLKFLPTQEYGKEEQTKSSWYSQIVICGLKDQMALKYYKLQLDE